MLLHKIVLQLLRHLCLSKGYPPADYEFTSGEPVLVRDSMSDPWRRAIFDKLGKAPYRYIVNMAQEWRQLSWRECVPARLNPYLEERRSDRFGSVL